MSTLSGCQRNVRRKFAPSVRVGKILLSCPEAMAKLHRRVSLYFVPNAQTGAGPMYKIIYMHNSLLWILILLHLILVKWSGMNKFICAGGRDRLG